MSSDPPEMEADAEQEHDQDQEDQESEMPIEVPSISSITSSEDEAVPSTSHRPPVMACPVSHPVLGNTTGLSASSPMLTAPLNGCVVRVKRELQEIRKHPPPNCSADMLRDDLFRWTAGVNGPNGTVYEGGHFRLDIRFPAAYPFRPPRIRFTTRIYHCNVDSRGAICLDVLGERWSPVMNVAKVLLSIYVLMGECNPDDPLVMCIADQYKTNRKEHDKIARHWTKRFAMPKDSKDTKQDIDPTETHEQQQDQENQVQNQQQD
ncbi:hypothetical protein KR067_002767, partial [Drosophila pandora]